MLLVSIHFKAASLQLKSQISGILMLLKACLELILQNGPQLLCRIFNDTLITVKRF